MNFMPNDREPVYLQIIRYIKQKVVRGELNPGDTIPSRREMAQILKVNPNTVQNSYMEMEEMGIINTITSYQSRITTDENIISQIRHDLITESMEVFIENMKAINVKKEELIEIIKDKY